MNKLEFVAKQLDKTKKKRYERLVVHRIWNTLNDLRVKFVTQQFVKRPEGRAMTDMYFPQLGIHVEVDEGHHKTQVEADKLREADIVDATGHQVFRIVATRSIEAIHKACDRIADMIKNEISLNSDFEPWDLEAEMNPQTYIDKGFIDVLDDAAFRTMADAASCFGKEYKGLQRGYIRHPVEPKKRLWFPKFYENENWNNQFSDDEKTVSEFCKIEGRANAYVNEALVSNTDVRLLFARVRGPLGDLLYRYKGEYELDPEQTNYENGVVYRRKATRSMTYPNSAFLGKTVSAPTTSDIHEIYDGVVSQLDAKERLRLAAMILNGLAEEALD